MKVINELGRVVMTRGAAEQLPPDDIVLALTRHSHADWGEVCEEDHLLNDQALADGQRTLSAYISANGIRFWVITEADHTVTTVLLPDEY